MPRAAVVLLFVFAGLTLVQDRLGGVGSESRKDLSERVDEMVDEDTDKDPFGISGATKTLRLPVLGIELSFRVLTGLLLTLYVVVGYLLGLFWATLGFVLVYARFADLSLRQTTVIMAITLVSLYVFGWMLNVPLMRSNLSLPLVVTG